MLKKEERSSLKNKKEAKRRRVGANKNYLYTIKLVRVGNKST